MSAERLFDVQNEFIMDRLALIPFIEMNPDDMAGLQLGGGRSRPGLQRERLDVSHGLPDTEAPSRSRFSCSSPTRPCARQRRFGGGGTSSSSRTTSRPGETSESIRVGARSDKAFEFKDQHYSGLRPGVPETSGAHDIRGCRNEVVIVASLLPAVIPIGQSSAADASLGEKVFGEAPRCSPGRRNCKEWKVGPS